MLNNSKVKASLNEISEGWLMKEWKQEEPVGLDQWSIYLNTRALSPPEDKMYYH